ncbi:MAG: ABC transporter permease, partial [Giesbergeria sp.]|nr:ABC transporter permease [Giesbergeria sp.]
MRLFLLRRFVTLLLTLAAASAVVFVVLDVLPGNAAQTMMGPDAAPEAVAELARQLGLDQPTWQRYRTWVQGLLHGDMGESYAYGSPVGELVAERLAVTVPLALIAMALAVAMA